MTDEEFKTGKSKPVRARNVALKDFHIFCPPDHDIKIKAGDNLDDVPEKFIPNLKTEGVLK